jgi:malate dehydrogenase (oxaloacetate-decarboxylating)(NADP+)
LIYEIPPAVAKAAMESGVAQEPIENWEKYKDELRARLGDSSKIVRLLHNRAKSQPKRIVFAEADHLDVLKAAQIVFEEGIGKPILLGNREIILELKAEIGFDEEVMIIDPKIDEEAELREHYAKKYWEKSRRKGKTLLEAKKWMRERNYFAAMMVNEGDADALITGYSRSYPTVLKPMLELIGMAKGVTRVAATNLMMTERGPMFLSDTSININPSARELAVIAKMTSRTVQLFGMEPIMAMMSYSNFGSSDHETSQKVSRAVSYLHKYYPDLVVDGELQMDFALNSKMLSENFPFSKLAGKKVNTLVFPNLDAANISYKMLKELNKSESIGPILMGMNKAVHVIQLGAKVEEMVNMAAVAVVDAQQKESM